MSYNPRDPDVLRRALKGLREDLKLSSEKILNLVEGDRKNKTKQERNDLPPFNLNRNALDRFRKGNAIKNHSGLQEVYRVLESNRDYRCYFQHDPVTRPPSAFAFFRFFDDGVTQHPNYDLTVLGDKLVGFYVMYRLNWWPPHEPGTAQASLVEIASAESQFTIAETQFFKETKLSRAYQQHDFGSLASFSRFIYFLMKEDSPGTAVKFGLITAIFPNNRDTMVDTLRGVLFVSSALAMFPLSRFFCRRTKDPNNINSRAIKITDVSDEEARAHLLEPLKLPY